MKPHYKNCIIVYYDRKDGVGMVMVREQERKELAELDDY